MQGPLRSAFLRHPRSAFAVPGKVFTTGCFRILIRVSVGRLAARPRRANAPWRVSGPSFSLALSGPRLLLGWGAQFCTCSDSPSVHQNLWSAWHRASSNFDGSVLSHYGYCLAANRINNDGAALMGATSTTLDTATPTTDTYRMPPSTPEHLAAGGLAQSNCR